MNHLLCYSFREDIIGLIMFSVHPVEIWTDQFLDQWAVLQDSLKLGNFRNCIGNLLHPRVVHTDAKFIGGVGTELV